MPPEPQHTGLHAAIADYLARQRRHQERERRILAIWHERDIVPRCQVCGAPVDNDDDGLYNLTDMQMVRQCHLHYTPF
jgi:hypothetical protein